MSEPAPTSQSVAFDRAVDFYDQTRGFPPDQAAAIGRLIVEAGGLTSASRALEIGVGTGRIALLVAPAVDVYVGVDISAPMMSRLRAKQNGERIHLAQADATRLPFAASAFDVVIAIHVFHLIPNWRIALDEVRRTLRPGGRLLHAWTKADPAYQRVWDSWRTALGPAVEQDVGVHWRHHANFLEDAGWQPDGPALTHPYAVAKAPLTLVDDLRSRLWSQTWRLTDEQIEAGAAALQRDVETEFSQPQAVHLFTSHFHARAYRPPA